MTQTGFGRKGVQQTARAATRMPVAPTTIAPERPVTYDRARPRKSLIVAYVLWYFAFVFSAHRFYLGAYRSACLQTAMIMGGGIAGYAAHKADIDWLTSIFMPVMLLGLLWGLADVFLIPGVRRKIETDADPFAGSQIFA